MFGVDLVLDREEKTPAVDSAEQVLYACLAMGLSFKVSQGSFLTLTPPLTIEAHALERALTILEKAFQDTLKK